MLKVIYTFDFNIKPIINIDIINSKKKELYFKTLKEWAGINNLDKDIKILSGFTKKSKKLNLNIKYTFNLLF